MLSPISRVMTYITALLSALTGIILFLAPDQVAPFFAWMVTPFMAMTIGGWCLGNAWLAFLAARRWDWTRTFAAHTYLWLFGIFQSIVLVAFLDKLSLGHPVAWLYLAMIVANLLTAIISLIDFLSVRPVARPSTRPYSPIVTILNWIFVVLVVGLGLYGVFAPLGAPGTNGGIFPEIMSAFTLRAFGAFYLALGLGALPLAMTRDVDAMLFHSIASYGFIILITAAIVTYFRLFNLNEAPGGMIYIGAYLLVGIVIAIVLYLHQDSLKDNFEVGAESSQKMG